MLTDKIGSLVIQMKNQNTIYLFNYILCNSYNSLFNIIIKVQSNYFLYINVITFYSLDFLFSQ